MSINAPRLARLGAVSLGLLASTSVTALAGSGPYSAKGVATVTTTPPVSDDKGFYFGADGGVAVISDPSVEDLSDLSSSDEQFLRFAFGDSAFNRLMSTEIETDNGPAFNAFFGYFFTKNFGLEAQGGYMSSDFSGDFSTSTLLGRAAVELDGSLEAIPVFINARFRLPLTEVLSLHLGAGAGAIHSSVEYDATGSLEGFGSDSISDDYSEWNFAIQGLASLDYALTDSLSLNAGYRFFHVDEYDIQAHQFVGGLTFRF